MSWGDHGYGLPVPLYAADQATFDAYVSSFETPLAINTKPVVDAADQPAGEIDRYADFIGEVLAQSIRYLDPERGTEYWVANPTA